MYVKRIQLHNYGPITRLDIECPFDEDKPKPVVLVGENGSGKSILLSHIVNGLLMAQQIAYPENPEVDEGKVYKLRSPLYIQSGKEYSFSKIDFEKDLYISELNLLQVKQTHQDIPESIAGTDAQSLWDAMTSDETSTVSTSFSMDKRVLLQKIFSACCILYFPPNRFEEPAWLNERNLAAKAQYTDLVHLQGYTDRRIINYSPLRENENWLFDVVYDFNVFERLTPQIDIPLKVPNQSDVTVPIPFFVGFSGKSKNLFDIALKIVQTILPQVEGARIGIGERSRRVVSVMGDGKRHVPNIFQLSSGETSLLNLFLSVLRDYDLCRGSFNGPEDVRGIVVVDEIDLHLHTKHQYEILPNLMKMFPCVQFVITTHSPLFLLGLQKTFGEDGFSIYHLPRGGQISPEEFREFGEAYRVFADRRRHAEIIPAEVRDLQQPVIYVEGETDVKYLTRAAELLGMQNLLEEAQLRDGGGSGNLKKVWKALTVVDFEHRTVILLHDCDGDVHSSARANVFQRIIPPIESHPIHKGIENLFSRETLGRAREHRPAFIDIVEAHKSTLRGKSQLIPEQWTVNKNEKVNLCKWLCENGTDDDFEHFRVILNDLYENLGLPLPISDQN